MSLKQLSNFWRTLEMLLIDCEINLVLTWPKNCVVSSGTGATKFKLTDTKLYVHAITLSTHDQVLKEHLIGTNINQKFQQKDKINI